MLEIPISAMISDPSDLRKWRTELPNLYDDADLTVYEFRLLSHYKRVGNCYEGTRTSAAKCHMSFGQVVAARKSLADKHWIRLGTSKYGTVRVTVCDVWARNFREYSGRSPGERCSPGERTRSGGERGVHGVNTGVHGVNERSNNRRKNLQKKEPAEEAAPRPPARRPAAAGKILKMLDQLHIEEPTRSQLAELPYLSLEYLGQLVDYARRHHQLGAGFWVNQIRAHWLPPKQQSFLDGMQGVIR